MRGLLFVVLMLCVAGQSSDERARAMLARMSEAEKLSWVAGSDSPSSGPSHYVGVLPSIPRLGLPAVTMEDGPQGVADGTRDTVAWPSAATVGQIWSEPLYYQCALPLLSLFFLLSLSWLSSLDAAALGAEQRVRTHYYDCDYSMAHLIIV